MLKEKLLAYNPDNAYELDCKARMLQFLSDHDDCFERSCIPGHFTGSSWLLNRERTHALLLHHKKLDMWLQLGGHCDGDADILATAIKEAQEESGILGIKALSEDIFDIDIHSIPARKNDPEHEHLDVRFLLAVDSDEEIVQNEESLDLRWFHKDASDFPSSVIRMVETWRKLP